MIGAEHRPRQRVLIAVVRALDVKNAPSRVAHVCCQGSTCQKWWSAITLRTTRQASKRKSPFIACVLGVPSKAAYSGASPVVGWVVFGKKARLVADTVRQNAAFLASKQAHTSEKAGTTYDGSVNVAEPLVALGTKTTSLAVGSNMLVMPPACASVDSPLCTITSSSAPASLA